MFKPILRPSLDELLHATSATGADYVQARSRADKIASLLMNDRDSGVFDWRLSGSAGKGTALAPLSDLDLVIYVDGRAWKNGAGDWVPPSDLLIWLYERIAYARTWQVQHAYLELQRKRRCVAVSYTRDDAVDIDVVPILVAGNNKAHGWIPDAGIGEYRTTSIERQFVLFDRLDTRRGDVRAGIRLLKLWAKGHKLPLKSYAVEVLGLFAASEGADKNSMGILWWVLDTLAEGLLAEENVHISEFFDQPDCDDEVQVFDPADEDNNLTADLTADDAEAVAEAALHALRHLRAAERMLSRNRFADPQEEIAEAFGLELEDEE